MKIRKSQQKPQIQNKYQQIDERQQYPQQQSNQIKIIYPKKRKIKQIQKEKQKSIINRSNSQSNSHREYYPHEQKSSRIKYNHNGKSQSALAKTKKSFRKTSNYGEREDVLKQSKISSYKPKVLESYAIEKTNPENQNNLRNSRESRNNRVLSEKHILKQSNYAILQSDVRSQKSNSSFGRQKKNMKLNEVINQVGIRNDYPSNRKNDNFMNQYIEQNGINQFIRRKKQSATSSLLGRAYTQPPQNLKTIKQIQDETFQSSLFKDRRKFISRSQVTQSKLDMFVPFNNKFLPQIQGNRSMSKLMGGKIKTQNSSPSEFRNINDEINKQLAQKLLKKRKKAKSPKLQNKQKDKSKSPSQKRIRQDYKYVLEHDDSQRYHQRVKPLLNEEHKKIKLMKVKQQMLGKIVLQRVQKHLKQQKKQKGNYITKVKSQKSIDQALIQFLKMKVNRADKVLSKKV